MLVISWKTVNQILAASLQLDLSLHSGNSDVGVIIILYGLLVSDASKPTGDDTTKGK